MNQHTISQYFYSIPSLEYFFFKNVFVYVLWRHTGLIWRWLEKRIKHHILWMRRRWLPHISLSVFAFFFFFFLKGTTPAFNKHVIRKKTAGSCVPDGAVLGISEEGTTHADGSLFQHLVMHIAQNLTLVLNNQYKQCRCCCFSHGFGLHWARPRHSGMCNPRTPTHVRKFQT